MPAEQNLNISTIFDCYGYAYGYNEGYVVVTVAKTRLMNIIEQGYGAAMKKFQEQKML